MKTKVIITERETKKFTYEFDVSEEASKNIEGLQEMALQAHYAEAKCISETLIAIDIMGVQLETVVPEVYKAKKETDCVTVELVDHPEYRCLLRVEHGLIIVDILKFDLVTGWHDDDGLTVEDMTTDDQQRIENAIETMKEDPELNSKLD